jgi:aspartate racemase
MNPIGIVGGMGPHAGLDLTRKVFEETRAAGDREHLPVALLSYPGTIPDRSAYVLGRSDENPAAAIFEVVRALDRLGATVAGMPCNTAHAPPIFDEVRARMDAAGLKLRLVHMVEEVGRHLAERGRPYRRLALLATRGTYAAGTYRTLLEPRGFTVLVPDEEGRARVHAAIYDETYGIKACSEPVSERAVRELRDVVAALRDQGAEAVVVGCTELPLALGGDEVDGLPLVDPTRILARALIREAAPEKLRPLAAVATPDG